MHVVEWMQMPKTLCQKCNWANGVASCYTLHYVHPDQATSLAGRGASLQLKRDGKLLTGTTYQTKTAVSPMPDNYHTPFTLHI